MKLALLALLVLIGACHDESAVCQCTPVNALVTKHTDLLTMLRRHRRLVSENAPHRDVKLVDDEIRLVASELCQPCGWVDDRTTVDEMFPVAKLDDATGAVCLGLVLRDGTTAFGSERPNACR